MDRDTETDSEVSSMVSTPNATPTLEVEKQAKIQSQPESLKERLAEVQSGLGSEIESVLMTGSVSPNILGRIKILENPIQTRSVLFQNLSKNSLESNVEIFSDIETI